MPGAEAHVPVGAGIPILAGIPFLSLMGLSAPQNAQVQAAVNLRDPTPRIGAKT